MISHIHDLAPEVAAGTVIICILMATRVNRENLRTIDGVFALIGLIVGLLVVLLSLFYANNYIIVLGPVLAIASLIYLAPGKNVIVAERPFRSQFRPRALKGLQLIYWTCIVTIGILLVTSSPYNRSFLLFAAFSLVFATLGLQILLLGTRNRITALVIMGEMLLASLLLRASAFFVSPYPVGADPWLHADFIGEILRFHSLDVPLTQTAEYYTHYPLMHIFTAEVSWLSGLTVKESMFVCGAMLAVSLVFGYCIVREMTKNANIAFLTLLFLSFTDSLIEWSVQVIAMTFGIAIFIMLLYLIVKAHRSKSLRYTALIVFALVVLVWTHTVTALIAAVTLFGLYSGSLLYRRMYSHPRIPPFVSRSVCFFFLALLLFQWMNPEFPFLKFVARGLFESLTSKAEFLGRHTLSNVADRPETILEVIGFAVFVFLGAIGSLRQTSRRSVSIAWFAFLSTMVLLLVIQFSFPLIAIGNLIVAGRWPAFVAPILSMFAAVGITCTILEIPDPRKRALLVFATLLLSSFFMVSNSVANVDSPIYGEKITPRLLWTDSEVTLFSFVNDSYADTVVADVHSQELVFQGYLKNGNCIGYPITVSGGFDWNSVEGAMIIWREASSTRPVDALAPGHVLTEILFGPGFLNDLERSSSCISDTGSARAYLSF